MFSCVQMYDGISPLGLAIPGSVLIGEPLVDVRVILRGAYIDRVLSISISGVVAFVQRITWFLVMDDISPTTALFLIFLTFPFHEKKAVSGKL
jgi:hypothetical protein